MKRDLPDLSQLATPGTMIEVRVTPRAAADRLSHDDGRIRIAVTTAPEGGKANRAVTRLLARALGIAPSRLVLLRGETGRDKLFRVEG